jgi:hypothetical protein
MKKLQDMTEEEVLNHVATAIHDYLMRIRPQHGEFVLDHCMARQISELTMLFRYSRGLGRRDSLSRQDTSELNMTINHFLPGMQEQARAVQLHYTKEQTLWKIRGTSAAELIKKAFKDIGMNAEIECQRYRAKVFVDLGGRTLRFYVAYKTLDKLDTLPNVVQAVLDIKDAACRIGGDIKLGR